MFKHLRSVIKTPEVEFLCHPEDFGVIPEPVPARKVLPEWFKKLPQRIDGQTKLNNSTVKRCMPVLDAFSTGWIIPLAADVEIITNGTADQLTYKWNFHKTMVENHSYPQVAGHPEEPKPPLKWINYWVIKLPPGYSMLFVPPLNRYEPRFECFSGMVDDTYMGQGALEYINFPFFFKQPNYTGIVKAGTPLVQAIPIRRDDVFRSSDTIKVGQMSQEDINLREHTRKRRGSHESLYRDTLRCPKEH